ncbi:MAG TPA: chemotaxis protein CheB [Candidatus Obscuribacterales bacterium]
MSKHKIVVIGASAGGMEALKKLVSQLPANFTGAVFIVWHVAPGYPSVLPEILQRVCPLSVKHAIDKEAIEPGRIYVAPPDRHLVVEPGYVRVTNGPKENRFRPSVDVLFRSAAVAYESQVIAIVLTGFLDDGASGLYAVKQQSGKAVVQDPLDALHPSMPIQAMKAVTVDYCVPVALMGDLLVRLTKEVFKEKRGNPVLDQMKIEVKVAREDNAFESGIMKLGKLSPYTCPECHGVLLQLHEGNLIRFRCHTGHAYSLNSLLLEVTESIETSLWSTLRGIEESQLLMRHMADHLHEVNNPQMAELFKQKAEDAKQQADLVRQAVMSNEILSKEKLTGESECVP